LKVVKVTLKSVVDSKGRRCKLPTATIEFDGISRCKAAGCDPAVVSVDEIGRRIEQAINR